MSPIPDSIATTTRATRPVDPPDPSPHRALTMGARSRRVCADSSNLRPSSMLGFIPQTRCRSPGGSASCSRLPTRVPISRASMSSCRRIGCVCWPPASRPRLRGAGAGTVVPPCNGLGPRPGANSRAIACRGHRGTRRGIGWMVTNAAPGRYGCRLDPLHNHRWPSASGNLVRPFGQGAHAQRSGQQPHEFRSRRWGRSAKLRGDEQKCPAWPSARPRQIQQIVH